MLSNSDMNIPLDIDREESTCQWIDEVNRRQDEAKQEDRYWEEELMREKGYEVEEPCDRDDLRDDGRSDGYGESYAERNA